MYLLFFSRSAKDQQFMLTTKETSKSFWILIFSLSLFIQTHTLYLNTSISTNLTSIGLLNLPAAWLSPSDCVISEPTTVVALVPTISWKRNGHRMPPVGKMEFRRLQTAIGSNNNCTSTHLDRPILSQELWLGFLKTKKYKMHKKIYTTYNSAVPNWYPQCLIRFFLKWFQATRLTKCTPLISICLNHQKGVNGGTFREMKNMVVCKKYKRYVFTHYIFHHISASNYISNILHVSSCQFTNLQMKTEKALPPQSTSTFLEKKWHTPTGRTKHLQFTCPQLCFIPKGSRD